MTFLLVVKVCRCKITAFKSFIKSSLHHLKKMKFLPRSVLMERDSTKATIIFVNDIIAFHLHICTFREMD